MFTCRYKDNNLSLLYFLNAIINIYHINIHYPKITYISALLCTTMTKKFFSPTKVVKKSREEIALKTQIRERNILVAEAICKRGVSIRNACAKLNANRTTVSRRLNGGRSHRQASQENQYLTPAEETAICEIIKKVFPSPISSLGRNTYRKLGQTIFDKTYNGTGPHKHFSESWEHRLRQRQKQLNDFKRNKKLYSALNVDVFKNEFYRLRQVVDEYNITPDNFYSVGELSFYVNQMGIDSVGVGPEFREGFMDVFYDEAKTEVVHNPPVHAIAFECCSAACQTLPTFVAFQNDAETEYFNGEAMVVSEDMSADNDRAFLEWLRLFDKYTRSTTGNQPFRLIYFAAHFFNLSIDVLDFAVKNNILFYASPPERSHMHPVHSMLEVMASRLAENTYSTNAELLQSIDDAKSRITSSFISSSWKSTGLLNDSSKIFMDSVFKRVISATIFRRIYAKIFNFYYGKNIVTAAENCRICHSKRLKSVISSPIKSENNDYNHLLEDHEIRSLLRAKCQEISHRKKQEIYSNGDFFNMNELDFAQKCQTEILALSSSLNFGVDQAMEVLVFCNNVVMHEWNLGLNKSLSVLPLSNFCFTQSNVLDVFGSSTSSDSRLSTPPSSDDHYQYTDPTLSSELSDDIIKQEANDANPSFTPEYVYDDFMLFPLKF